MPESNRNDFLEALRVALAEATGKQFGLARAPEGEELLGEELRLPYAYINPILSVPMGTDMESASNSKDHIFQVVSVGSTPKQAGWMSDKIFTVMTLMENGSYTYPLLGDEWAVEWRLCDQLGAILPTGRSLFNQLDNYRIRKGT